MSATSRGIDTVDTPAARLQSLAAGWLCLALAVLILVVSPEACRADQAGVSPTVAETQTAQEAPQLRGSLGVDPADNSAQTVALHGTMLSAGEVAQSGKITAEIATFTLREIAVSVILLVLGGLIAILGFTISGGDDGRYGRS